MFGKQDTSTLIAISREEFLKISTDLEQFHKVFDVFWNLSSIFFAPEDHQCKTACVSFSQGGKSHMIINTSFWQSLNEDEKLFVVLHECLHIMLDHGIRNARHIPGATSRLINIAQDITINEMIIELFGFTRGLIREWKKYCWIETCFEDPSNIQYNQVFEYYLRKLIEQNIDPETDLFDDHGDEAGNGDDEYNHDNADSIAQTLGEYLTFDELEKIVKAIGKEGSRGIHASPFNTILENRTPVNIKFDQLVKRLKRTAKAKNHQEVYSFETEHRRISHLDGTMLLPGTVERKPKNNKLMTLVFFDVSGSCMPYIAKLNAVKDAFEKEKDLFDMQAYVFDTQVRLVSAGKPIAVGGGTSFDIIEVECQRVMKEDGKYPDCVVIITDGDGNPVAPEYPSRWVWLLTDGGKRTYVDTKSTVWPIKNVTF